MPLTKEAILAAADIKSELVSVPEWGGEVLVRGLTGAERDRFEADSLRQSGRGHSVSLDNIKARLCALAMVDDGGKRLFADTEVSKLGEKSAAALTRVYEAAQRLSGLRPDDVEEIRKN